MKNHNDDPIIQELLAEISLRLGRKVTSVEEVEDYELYRAELELKRRRDEGKKES
jgi:hypothetical protein